MSIIKNLAIAIVLGLIGYEINYFLLGNGSQLSLNTATLGQLVVFTAVALSGIYASGGSDAGDRELGTVKWFNTRKGYGFITRDQGEDIFVHFRNIEGSGRKSINEGERVSFIVISSDKGPQADKVKAA